MKQITVIKDSEIKAIVDFSQKYPWKPQYPENLVERFLSEFISDKSLIFDFHDETGRIATAVLLDKVNNPANDACLEILGVKAGIDFKIFISQIIRLARDLTPKQRSGFQLSLQENFELKNYGLSEHYDTYEMNLQIQEVPQSSEEIIDANENNGQQIYDILCKSFAQNPDTSIPEFKDWIRNFLKNPHSHFYVWKTDPELLGFANLIENDESTAEIRTIGVLPDARGEGIGNKLLFHCIKKAKDFGKISCKLSVAVQNERALGLYLRAGFKVFDKFKCYRKSLR